MLHLFIVPAVIACAVQRPQTRQGLIELLQALYPLLQGELFMGWRSADVASQVEAIVAVLAEQELVQLDGEQLLPPEHCVIARGAQVLLSRVALETLLRLAVVLTQLRHAPDKARAELEQESQVVALRLAELHAIHAPEFLDRKVFAALIQALRDAGYLDSDGQSSEPLLWLQQQVLELLPAEMATTVVEVCAPPLSPG